MKITDEQIVANILRFNKEVTELNVKYSEEIEELKEENKRLNNIINELEKWLNGWKNLIYSPDIFEDGIISCINDTLNQLHLLKEVK